LYQSRGKLAPCRSRFTGAIPLTASTTVVLGATRAARSVKCPIWVQGSLGGEYLRRSLDLVSWQAAQDRVRGWEASGEVGLIRADIPNINEAIERFFEDAQARGLAEATIGKLNVLLRKQLLPWCRGKGYLSLKQLTVDELTQFRATWADSPISKYKKQERLKSFFHFCVAREWVRTNPVLGIKPVNVPPSPTLPFEEEQMKAIRDTFAVELLKNGVSLETVSMLLGHASIKVTEKHYKPWVKTLQEKLETEAMKGWPSQPSGRRRRRTRGARRAPASDVSGA
jgi:hypothetical protein